MVSFTARPNMKSAAASPATAATGGFEDELAGVPVIVPLKQSSHEDCWPPREWYRRGGGPRRR